MNQIVKIQGSILEVAQNTSIAEVLESVELIILFDSSSSMDNNDTETGQTRYEYALEQLKIVQAQFPGKICIVSFNKTVMFNPDGIPMKPNSTTDLAMGLQYIAIADGIPDLKLLIISDGEPDSEHQAFAEAKRFTTKIDTIYIGPSDGAGEHFLRELSRRTGGYFSCNAMGKYLSNSILKLLVAKC